MIWMHSAILINQDGSFHQTDWFWVIQSIDWYTKKSVRISTFPKHKTIDRQSHVLSIHRSIQPFVHICLFVCSFLFSFRIVHSIKSIYFYFLCFVFNRHHLGLSWCLAIMWNGKCQRALKCMQIEVSNQTKLRPRLRALIQAQPRTSACVFSTYNGHIVSR